MKRWLIRMGKIFEVTHKGHHIRVENSWFSGEKLYVDSELQDQNLGFNLGASLTGMLRTDKGNEPIKVALGGTWQIHCKIFVDYKLVYTDE